MALIAIGDYISLATGFNHTATSWEISDVEDFSRILDYSYKDTKNVKQWHTPVTKADGTGYHADLDKLYARFKIWEGDTCSDWFYCQPKNQNDQMVIYTENNEIVSIKNSLEIGFN